MSNEDGDPVVFDPAVYYGHREMDIAMSKLFGGFEAEFYDETIADAYSEFSTMIKIIGFLSCVDEVFRQSDIHIFPSGCEGSPKSVYEACASGLAQITTFEAGDVVRDEVNGLIVPPNDVVALANAIRRLYKSPRRILQYGRAARQRAETEFTWDHFRERLARAYDLVLRRSTL